MAVPLLDLKAQYATIKDEVLREIAEISDSQYFILGPKVEKLENEIAKYCQSNCAVGVTSGSDALIIALMVENIGPDDEVIIPPFTFFATAGAVARVGATPVFADIDPVTYNLDPAKVAEKVTGRTKAIIPVHLFGQSADMDPIMEIAKKHNLIVIEDACQAIGAEYKGRRVGSIGDYGCFSFFPSKNLGCFGDGGMVTCNDPEKAKKLKIFRNHGQSGTYMHDFVGGNFRLDALQAGILSIKLRYLDSWSQARQQNAAEYDALFAQADLGEKVSTPKKANYPVRHIYNQYCIEIADGKRDELLAHLRELGIGCAVYYPLSLHLQKCFAKLGGKAGDFPVSEAATGRIMALPIYPESTSEQRKSVVEAITAFLK
ncbi:MAG: DegT/DnrJ/EryC1/StrS family aminotransferase [Victivallales bacterium]|jgi:dTDP-4-amino-4,6-dideoxygalactose transaminase|nr:DegT/DnrJ/EryC1/StrS family aminotransferase [Victivallales bacterium]